MNGRSIDDTAAKRQGKPLRLGQARVIVMVMTSVILLLAAEGIHDIHAGNKLGAILYCSVAAFWLLTLPIYVFLYLQVKKGEKIILRPMQLPELPRVPFWVSITFTSLLTLLVASASVTSFSGFATFRSSTPKLIIIGVNLFFWLITAFVWYCALATERRQEKSGPILEQAEGIWPPAPQRPENE